MRKIKKLLSDWLLVELEPARKKTAGGILLPDADKEPVRTGVILMAGPGRRYMDKFVPMPDSIVGKRVSFMIAASHTKGGKQLRTHLDMENNRELIRLGDVLLEVDGAVEVRGCG